MSMNICDLVVNVHRALFVSCCSASRTCVSHSGRDRRGRIVRLHQLVCRLVRGFRGGHVFVQCSDRRRLRRGSHRRRRRRWHGLRGRRSRRRRRRSLRRLCRDKRRGHCSRRKHLYVLILVTRRLGFRGEGPRNRGASLSLLSFCLLFTVCIIARRCTSLPRVHYAVGRVRPTWRNAHGRR